MDTRGINARKLETIRSLLAKAESTTFPEEAETLTAKAMELMIQHGIDEAMLAKTSLTRDEVTAVTVQIRNPYSGSKMQLLYAIARSQSCQSVAHADQSGRSYSRATLVGFRSDVELVELLFTSLLLQATGQLVGLRPEWPQRVSVSTYRKSWFSGFVMTVSTRLSEIRRHVTEASEARTPGTALAVIDRDETVTRFFTDMFNGRLQTTNHSSRVHGVAYDAGVTAGQRADLGQTRVGQRRGELSS